MKNNNIFCQLPPVLGKTKNKKVEKYSATESSTDYFVLYHSNYFIHPKAVLILLLEASIVIRTDNKLINESERSPLLEYQLDKMISLINIFNIFVYLN